MKVVGIYTHPLISNYGGILQNYALQQVLIKEGFNPITIDRVPTISNLKCFLGKVKQKIFKHHSSKILYRNQIELIIKESQRFIDKNISRIKLVNPNDSELYSSIVANDIASIIVGSDQVWRPSINNGAKYAFLGFVPKESNIDKIAYAASFGTSKWEFSSEDTVIAKNLIKDFKTISVREESGVNLCQEYLDSRAQVVLDPALLLDREDYLKVCNNERRIDKGKIFTYILDRNKVKDNIVQEVSSVFNKPIFENQPRFSQEENWHKNFSVEDFKFPSIEGWLDSFEKASFVVTDSFHGTVFSIIFNKQFIAIGNKERGLARFESLLKLFGLEDRLVVDYNESNMAILNKQIDFEAVNEKRNLLKKESVEFLLNSLK
ncbi:polysaccharide pyruvyl transferase family protein [Myroides odoratimimus]|uniref:polysaccharide pyruvyl transferase family protein n=1 Tax=Myroides odoratimimus TaxID=76832 RepID=UPI0029BFE546|nr:polysaccharide pyruvyl transferase family protein [Myroides odoratimimus]MDX4975384.1 polysaccharide pyruvyl transferase family protein [Myroides odoratimimus]